MKPAQRLALFLVLADLALFAFFFAVALYSYSASRVIPLLALRWEIATACIDACAWLAPVHFFVSILAVSRAGGEMEGLVAKLAVPAVAISIVLAAAALIALPLFQQQVESSLATSRRFTESMDGLKAALVAGRADAARTDFDILEAIDATDPRLSEYGVKLENLELKARREEAATLAAEHKDDPAGARAAWSKARTFYEKGDWYNAHWQATLAASLDPGLVEAKRLAALAWEELSKATGETPKGAAESAFFAEKLRGYGLLRSGDFVGAWKVFDGLAKDHGNDIEVRRYLKESLSGVERTAFFKDEADAAAVESSLSRLFLRFSAATAAGSGAPKATGARPGGGATDERVLVAREVAWVSGAAYLFDLEYLEARSDGSALLVSSRWGKVTGGRLYLVAAERSTPGLAFRPTALDLPAGGGEAKGVATRAPASVELGIEVDDFVNMALARRTAPGMKVLDLWSTVAAAPRYGLDPEPLILELLRRLGIPFALFGASALGLLVGLRFRIPAGRKRGYSILALPFVGALTLLGWDLAAGFDDLVSAWTAHLLPDLRAVALSAGIRVAVILLAALLAAGATRENSSPAREE